MIAPQPKLVFDTLAYAESLEHGVPHAAIHSVALASAIAANVYVKSEVNSILENTLRYASSLN